LLHNISSEKPSTRGASKSARESGKSLHNISSEKPSIGGRRIPTRGSTSGAKKKLGKKVFVF